MWYHGWPLHRATDEQVAAALVVLVRDEADWLERGAKLCDAGEMDPDGVADCAAQTEYWHAQRELVARRGSCTGGCAARKIVEYGWRKEAVCRQTGEACAGLRLAAIVELWSRVNRHGQAGGNGD